MTDSKGRVLVICPYPQGVAAGQRLKYEPYVEAWRREGWHVDIAPYMDMGLWAVVWKPGNPLVKALGVVRGHLRRMADLFRIGRYDVVYLFMWATPFGTTIFERLIRARAKRLVYDVEDNIAVRNDDAAPHLSPVVKMLKGPRKARYLIREADEVVVASDYLQPAYARLNRYGRCQLIPPSLDTKSFVPAERPASERNGGLVTIGWTGTFSSKPYLDMVAPILRDLARQDEFRFRVIGNFDYALPGVDLEVLQWAREDEVCQLQGIDVGIYPLPDNEWAMGKAGLKIIQYHAVGLPCVASHAGISPSQIEDGATGFLVRSEAEWISALSKLIRDPALRRQMGAAGRAEAVRRYSRDVIAERYRRLLTKSAQAA